MKDSSVALNSHAKSGLPRARARFLAQAIQLEEQAPSVIIRMAIWFTVSMLVAAILWARVTVLAEVTSAPGEVVPAGLIHDVQHLEGGIVSEVLVRNGDRVKKGELLLRFAPPASQSEYEQILVRKGSLKMEAERLQAVIEKRQPDFGAAGQQFPELARKQLMIYKAQIASFESELGVIDAQIRQRTVELVRQKNQADSIDKEIALLQEQVNIRTRLNADQVVARTELISTQSRLAEVEGKRRGVADSIVVATSARSEAQQRRLELFARTHKELELEAGEVAERLAEVEQSLIRLRDRVTRLDMRAPVDGIVQGLTITRINAVVDPGQVIMQIVPVDDELIVEARISPAKIGHVRLGQQAVIKVDSFDYARFGSVSGEVFGLSPSTYLNDQREPYYRAELRLDSSHVGEASSLLSIIPGMTVQVDIQTGNKTILDYLLKPISRGFNTAFRER